MFIPLKSQTWDIFLLITGYDWVHKRAPCSYDAHKGRSQDGHVLFVVRNE